MPPSDQRPDASIVPSRPLVGPRLVGTTARVRRALVRGPIADEQLLAGLDSPRRVVRHPQGAQAVAALAHGTDTVLPVDKIVGPGNSWVANAKRQVFGKVGIDMIAGPSEILVYVEPPMDPDWVAMDLFSQAEHDEDAQPIFVHCDQSFADKVHESMNRLLPTLERASIIAKSINNRCIFIDC